MFDLSLLWSVSWIYKVDFIIVPFFFKNAVIVYFFVWKKLYIFVPFVKIIVFFLL